MKKYFSISSSVLLALVLIAFGSCKDAWNEHYSFKETESKYPVAKLAETLSSIDGYEKFCEALSTTRMVDKKGKPINMTYMDLLDEDQFLTVWAPTNDADVDWALYTKRDKTDAEHKMVGEQFIMNHIARFKHSVGAGSSEKIKMMNGKAYSTDEEAIAGIDYQGDDKNIRCSNGVLHCIGGALKRLDNLYEFITTDPRYKPLFGDWFKSYTVEEIDPSRSVAQGVNENGEMVYVDSVMNEYNRLMSLYGRILSEDSDYVMVLPTPELWETVYNHIKPSFVYGEKYLNNDSLQRYYTTTTMMSDMFFSMNPKVQVYLPDSICSTLYSAYENRTEGKPYHIFGHPYDNTGLFGSAVETVECSNGKIYIIDQWPFADTLTYIRTIKFEAENYTELDGFSLRTVGMIGFDREHVTENTVQVMRISYPGVAAWNAKMYIRDHLSGKYNIKMVVAPNVVDNMPCYVHPVVKFDTPTQRDSVLIDSTTTITTKDSRGRITTVTQKYMVSGSMEYLDTFNLGTVVFPYSNYDMNQARLSIELTSGVNEKNNSKYTSELWLDGFILEPVVE